MAEQDVKAIAVSRLKTVLGLLACAALLAVGIWLLTIDPEIVQSPGRYRSPLMVKGIGVATTLLFGAFLVIGIRGLADSRPGIVLSRDGLRQNSGRNSTTFVPWSDIVGLGIFKASHQRMLVVKLRDPERYLAGQSVLSRFLGRASIKTCGSPITLTSADLKIRFDDLVRTVEDYFQRYGQPVQ